MHKLRYDYRFVSFNLSARLLETIEKVCVAERITRSKWMRRAVRNELHRQRRTKMFEKVIQDVD